jgi:hypothetical protein
VVLEVRGIDGTPEDVGCAPELAVEFFAGEHGGGMSGKWSVSAV